MKTERKGESSAIPWKQLGAAAKDRGTIVILMATARMRATLRRLSDSGLPDETPAAAIEWASTAAQRTVLATLGTLADACARDGIGAPAVLVVGECAGLREHLKWVEKMPLFGRTIVVTRARATNSDFASGSEAARRGSDRVADY